MAMSVLVQLKSKDGFFRGIIKTILLLSNVIPISLKVNMDISKFLFSSQINRDKLIQAQVRNSSIPEELGRVQVLFTDKTGTLT